jgi:hypothetical protein
MNPTTLVLLLIIPLLGVGCKSVGPQAVTRDHLRYNKAVADAWKDQMLLNLVKTRYLDLPIYLDVGQIVSGYTMEKRVTLSGEPGAQGTFIDSPTITYTPLTGDKFLQRFLDPIPPARVVSLLRAGYAADFIIGISVDSMNGLRNQPVSLAAKHGAAPGFFRAAALMGELLDAGVLGLRVDQPANGQPAWVLFLRTDRVPPEVQAKVTEFRSLLSLGEGPAVFRIVQSPLRGGPGELSIATRSLIQIMAALSFGVRIPPAHLERKLAPPISEAPSEDQLPLRVQSGPEAPLDAFVAVPYEGSWFWIANEDWKSKRTFSSLLFLFTLSDSGGDRLPTITVPAQ